VGSLDPARALARGWSITRTADGALVRHAASLHPGDRLVTTLVDGTAESRIEPDGLNLQAPTPRTGP
jgi:exodeoxyribonuclease VII large subunit